MSGKDAKEHAQGSGPCVRHSQNNAGHGHGHSVREHAPRGHSHFPKSLSSKSSASQAVRLYGLSRTLRAA